jgi:hypothetical protein
MATPTHIFSPGVYAHYKGGTYSALALIPHHEHREDLAVVEYVSLTKGNRSFREYRQSDRWGRAVDAWTDRVKWEVPVPAGVPLTSDGLYPRFVFVRALA